MLTRMEPWKYAALFAMFLIAFGTISKLLELIIKELRLLRAEMKIRNGRM